MLPMPWPLSCVFLRWTLLAITLGSFVSATLPAAPATDTDAPVASQPFPGASNQDLYLRAYLQIADGEKAKKAGDSSSARASFLKALGELQELQARGADFEDGNGSKEIARIQAEIADLDTKPLSTAVQNTPYSWKTGIQLTTYSAPSLNKNLFYAALPFNDLVHPDLAKKWVPGDWQASTGSKSVCKERWIQIKDASGRSCYAQWEGTGSLRTDNAEYVFGTAAPKGIGLLISPGVARYLGFDHEIDAKDHPSVSWRFVEDKEVPPGYWLLYLEQAVLLTGIRQQDEASAKKSIPMDSATADSSATLPELYVKTYPNGLPIALAPSTTLPEMYLKAYLMIHDALNRQKAGDLIEARAAFVQALDQFNALAAIDPVWERALVMNRMKDIQVEIDSLDKKKPDASPVPDVH